MEDVNWIVVLAVVFVLGAITALVLRGKGKFSLGKLNVEAEGQKKEAIAAKEAEIEGSKVGSVAAVRGDASYDSASAAENAKIKNSEVQEIVAVDMSRKK